MVKKAKLDVLDFEVNEDEKHPQEDLPSAAEENKHEAGEKRILRYIFRNPFFLMLFGVMSVIVLLAGATWFFYEPGKLIPEKKHLMSKTSTVTAPAVTTTAYLRGFIIDLQDEKSDTRLILCDMAVELAAAQEVQSVGNRTDLRRRIYEILRERKLQELMTAEGRGRLKERIKSELNRVLGYNLVKDLYFMRMEAI